MVSTTLVGFRVLRAAPACNPSLQPQPATSLQPQPATPPARGCNQPLCARPACRRTSRASDPNPNPNPNSNPNQVPDICLPMVAPGKGLDEMFLPGSITLGEGAPQMTGEAPS